MHEETASAASPPGVATISIREILAETLGQPSMTLSWAEVGSYLSRHYVGEQATKERERRERHQRRQDLYRDGGRDYAIKLLEKVFKDERVKELRKHWAEAAQFNNACKRIVNELSTVYQEPPTRRVADDASNQRYARLRKACKQDRRFRHAGRMLNLHRAIILGFRVRNAGTMAKPRPEPVIDVIAPNQGFIITHPTDSGVMIGVGIQIETKYAHDAHQAPCWVVWTEHERFHLDKTGFVIPNSVVEHGIGRLPFVLVTLEDDSASVWPGMSGEDLVAGQLAISFANTCLLKETKSATKLPVLSGDASRTARNQMADSEGMFEPGEGVTVSTVDLSMELDMFSKTADHVQDALGNNYGVAATLMRHQGTQSAEARELIRVPIRELRLEQQIIWRDAEDEFVHVQAAVIDAEARSNVPGMAAFQFSPEGFRVDFADPQTPRSYKERLEEFKLARELTLDSTVRFLQRMNPDIDDEQAWTIIEQVIADELRRNIALRPLQRISGSPGATTPSADPPPGDGPQPPPGNGRTGDADPDGRQGDAGQRAKEAA